MMLLTFCEIDDKKEENKATAPATNEPAKTPDTEPTKSPVITEEATAKPTPTFDPSVDYSKWGKHGFERMLPIPLPFSDEEADWRSRQLTSSD